MQKLFFARRYSRNGGYCIGNFKSACKNDFKVIFQSKFKSFRTVSFVAGSKEKAAALLDEIEAIVYSGTTLNIDYYLEQTLDEDVIEEIYDYLHDEAESDDLGSIMEDLRDDYDELEVRLVRIKFLCEVAN